MGVKGGRGGRKAGRRWSVGRLETRCCVPLTCDTSCVELLSSPRASPRILSFGAFARVTDLPARAILMLCTLQTPQKCKMCPQWRFLWTLPHHTASQPRYYARHFDAWPHTHTHTHATIHYPPMYRAVPFSLASHRPPLHTHTHTPTLHPSVISLRRYKESLMGAAAAGNLGDANDPRRVVVEEFRVVLEDP